MSQKVFNFVKPLRSKFVMPERFKKHWFPGHMYRGVLQIQHQLKNVDCVIEVHDARIPFSGRNPRFKDVISLRPHILVLNKSDLIETKRYKQSVLDKLKSEKVENVLFTNSNKSKQKPIGEELVPMVLQAIESDKRYHRKHASEYNLLVIGVPNVGKSAFINSVRRQHTTLKKKVTQVGATAGVTRSVLNKIRVGFDPNIFLIDTPGILEPSVPDFESGMKLALCSCYPDHIIGHIHIVDYMLYWLNKNKEFDYVFVFELEEPVDNVFELLTHIAVKNKRILKRKNIKTGQLELQPDYIQAAEIALKLFRMGKLGRVMIDRDLLPVESNSYMYRCDESYNN